MPYTGSCACGAVTASIAGEPVATRQCWCRQCQTISGGGPTHNAMFRTEDVTIEGERSENSYIAASGNALTHEFCPRCGTPVLARSSARPQFRTIRMGFLDRPHGLKPAVAIWTEEAPDWAVFHPDVEQIARQPAPPPEPR